MITQLLSAPMLADVTVTSSAIGQALILLVVAIIVLSFLWWVNQSYVPEPMKRFGVLVIVLLFVIFAINLVLSFGGHGFVKF